MTPLLLVAFLSLSPAWAGAFNSGITSPVMIAQRSTHVDGSFPIKSSPTTITRRVPTSSSFLSLSTAMFVRGGQQADEDTVATPDETASVDAPSTNLRGASVESTADEIATKPSSVSSPLLSVMAPMTSLIQVAATLYTQQLTRSPILTKSMTAGIIFGLSDWCAQLLERGESEGEKDKLVFSRILTTFLVGLLFFGPAANVWYSTIFKVLPSTSLISTLQKAALGQIIFGPIFTCVFFGAGMIQSGSFSLGAWVSKIRSDLPAVWASGLGFWPVVDFISYKVVPVQWIPLFVNFCSFVWTIYLSLVANRSKSVEE
mmetsp:Transcript_18142/g.39219  ORF Transcript_18142/g.39219 Transcript_18142/m.39219 type:complete len:316 (-) Transcript_18142:496-1443(-)|eukprot:CAMPEP_0172305030 /NCGR_PEP_ID=MMETSP1058-20130122/6357_1 /TAXON_ID=83371 /ORGANISM="Detonula confervacea, Strain CCMP 353" /LENGTH=315 /DNA_ID=CAMNT_0013016473 /DNA_START=234 /DNA_END=1181 /DNA_ORIENTATION=-